MFNIKSKKVPSTQANLSINFEINNNLIERSKGMHS